MKLALGIFLLSMPSAFGCDATANKDYYHYEECIHKNRQVFTKELDEKCRKYEEMKLREQV